MEITDIRPSKSNSSRLAIYVDKKYSFSLNQQSILDTKIYKGEEIDNKRLDELKQIAELDKLYFLSLSYTSSRLKSNWQVSTYLKNKGASPALIDVILNKLSKLGLVDDYKFTSSYIMDRQRLRPTSLTKLKYDLMSKHIDKDVINKAIEDLEVLNESSLKEIISKKRRQLKYQDDQKLMQYLIRQGYNYGEVKEALNK